LLRRDKTTALLKKSPMIRGLSLTVLKPPPRVAGREQPPWLFDI
jgi:hypothetical protein